MGSFEKKFDSYVVAITPSNSITATLLPLVVIADFDVFIFVSYGLCLSVAKNVANKQRIQMPKIIFEINDAFILPLFMIVLE